MDNDALYDYWNLRLGTIHCLRWCCVYHMHLTLGCNEIVAHKDCLYFRDLRILSLPEENHYIIGVDRGEGTKYIAFYCDADLYIKYFNLLRKKT